MARIAVLWALIVISKFSKYKKSKWLQGHYKPLNVEKYVGNISKITYRSSWEKRLMIWLDKNPNVLKWNSEQIVLPYLSPIDGQMHRYYVDFMAKINTKKGVHKFLIEIKPYSQTQKPNPSKGKRKTTLLNEQKTYLINQAKWDSAKQYAKRIGADFIIITEKELGLEK